jgi:hypothetical protein
LDLSLHLSEAFAKTEAEGEHPKNKSMSTLVFEEPMAELWLGDFDHKKAVDK